MLTAEERRANQAFVRAVRELKHRTPTLVEVREAELIGGMSTLYLRTKRARMLRGNRNVWTVKLTRKLDRLLMPELTYGPSALPRGKAAARLVALLREDMGARFGDWCLSTAGRRLIRVTLANARFLRDFKSGSGFKPGLHPLVRVYRFMLRRREDIEACRTKAAIWRLVAAQFPKLDRPSFYRLLRELSLPLA